MRRALLAAGALVAVFVPAASAAGPGNDDRANAVPVVPPDEVAGTTAGSTLEPRDPTDCGPLDGTVWYRVQVPGKGRYVVRLQAGGKLDGVLGLYNEVRSRLDRVSCDRTDDKGRAATAFTTDGAGAVLVLVGQRKDSDPGPFKTITKFAGESIPATSPTALTLAPASEGPEDGGTGTGTEDANGDDEGDGDGIEGGASEGFFTS